MIIFKRNIQRIQRLAWIRKERFELLTSQIGKKITQLENDPLVFAYELPASEKKLAHDKTITIFYYGYDRREDMLLRNPSYNQRDFVEGEHPTHAVKVKELLHY